MQSILPLVTMSTSTTAGSRLRHYPSASEGGEREAGVTSPQRHSVFRLTGQPEGGKCIASPMVSILGPNASVGLVMGRRERLP